MKANTFVIIYCFIQLLLNAVCESQKKEYVFEKHPKSQISRDLLKYSDDFNKNIKFRRSAETDNLPCYGLTDGGVRVKRWNFIIKFTNGFILPFDIDLSYHFGHIYLPLRLNSTEMEIVDASKDAKLLFLLRKTLIFGQNHKWKLIIGNDKWIFIERYMNTYNEFSYIDVQSSPKNIYWELYPKNQFWQLYPNPCKNLKGTISEEYLPSVNSTSTYLYNPESINSKDNSEGRFDQCVVQSHPETIENRFIKMHILPTTTSSFTLKITLNFSPSGLVTFKYEIPSNDLHISKENVWLYLNIEASSLRRLYWNLRISHAGYAVDRTTNIYAAEFFRSITVDIESKSYVQWYAGPQNNNCTTQELATKRPSTRST